MAKPVIKEFKEIGLTALLHDNGDGTEYSVSLQLFSEHSPDSKYHTPSEWAKNDVDLAVADWAGLTLEMQAASGKSLASETLGLSRDDLLTLAHLDPQGRSLQHKVTYIGSGGCDDGKVMLLAVGAFIFLALLWRFYPQWMERLANLWWLFAALVTLILLGLILTVIFYKHSLNKTPEERTP